MFCVFQQGQDICLHSFFRSALVQGMQGELLEALDDVVGKIQKANSSANR